MSDVIKFFGFVIVCLAILSMPFVQVMIVWVSFAFVAGLGMEILFMKMFSDGKEAIGVAVVTFIVVILMGSETIREAWRASDALSIFGYDW